MLIVYFYYGAIAVCLILAIYTYFRLLFVAYDRGFGMLCAYILLPLIGHLILFIIDSRARWATLLLVVSLAIAGGATYRFTSPDFIESISTEAGDTQSNESPPIDESESSNIHEFEGYNIEQPKSDKTIGEIIEPEETKLSFVEVTVSELKNYVNSHARIKLKSGKEFKGFILDANEEGGIIKVQLRGGTAESTISYNRIDRAAVFK